MPSRHLAAMPTSLPPRTRQFKKVSGRPTGADSPHGGRSTKGQQDTRTKGRAPRAERDGGRAIRSPRPPKGIGAARSDRPARRRHPGRDLLSFRPFVLLSRGPGFGIPAPEPPKRGAFASGESATGDAKRTGLPPRCATSPRFPERGGPAERGGAGVSSRNEQSGARIRPVFHRARYSSRKASGRREGAAEKADDADDR